MRRLKKVSFIMIMIIMLFSVNCYANTDKSSPAASSTSSEPADLSCGKITETAKKFEQAGEQAATEKLENDDTVNKITRPAAQLAQIIATVGVLVIGCCMVILGIQWTMAKPSPEAQAKLKNRFVGLAITAGVLFGGYSIWKLVITILSSVF